MVTDVEMIVSPSIPPDCRPDDIELDADAESVIP